MKEESRVPSEGEEIRVGSGCLGLFWYSYGRIDWDDIGVETWTVSRDKPVKIIAGLGKWEKDPEAEKSLEWSWAAAEPTIVGPTVSWRLRDERNWRERVRKLSRGQILESLNPNPNSNPTGGNLCFIVSGRESQVGDCQTIVWTIVLGV